MSELAVGIDLGTSNSCVAIARGGRVEVLPNGYGERTSASVVSFAEDGSITVGNEAKANVIRDAENTIYSAKRLIGRYFFSEEVKKAQAVCSYEISEGPNHGVRVIARDEAFSLPEISAMVLREMKQIAEQNLGEPVTKAVITVPAYFNDNQRQATKDAGKIAGLEVLRILNEPTSAALAYGFGKGLNQRVAVYDLGGGTFDVSVLEIGKDIFEVLSTCGDTFLGGDDFDDRLIDLIADELVATKGVNVRNNPVALEKVKAAAERAKIAFSQDESHRIQISELIAGEDGEMISYEREISSEEFASLVQDLVMRTFKVCDEAMQQADLTTRDLDGVILVGGPTRLPIIRNAVGEYFQQDLRQNVDPDEVVAMGAAIHAASLVDSDQDSFLLDVTPLDLRIGVAGGLAEPVIERNTPVPIEQTRRFTTTRDDQDSVIIKVYQGGDRQQQGNEMLGQFEFSAFKKARRGDVAIDVTFEINADGIVNVTATEPESGQKASTRITLSSGLSDEELEEILEQDPTARVETAAADHEGAPAAAPLDDAPIDEFSEMAPVPDDSEADELEVAGPGANQGFEGQPTFESEADLDLEEDGEGGLELAGEDDLEVHDYGSGAPDDLVELSEAPAIEAEAELAPEPVAPPEPVAAANVIEPEPIAEAIPEPVAEVVEAHAEVEIETVAEPLPNDDGDEALVSAEAVDELDDDELLELADEVIDGGDETALAATRPHFGGEAGEGGGEKPAAAKPAADEYARQIEADPSQKEALFDTSNRDLSSDD